MSRFLPRMAPRHLAATLITPVVLAVATTLAAPAWAMPGGPGEHTTYGMEGGHGGHGRHGGGGMGMAFGHPRMAERMLDAVNATPEQRAQVRTLVEAARKDLDAQRASGRGLRDQAMTLFAQPTVDARAVEALRQQMLGQHDAASKRITQLMIDVSRVLTPEQRRQLGERMAQRRDMMERHQRERRALERPTS